MAILTVIVVNGLFAFLQEFKSDRALEMLQRLIAQKSRVVRDGAMQEIDAAELVPGDVIVLEEGDLVPADARVTEAFEVEVDNSSLTGESSPAAPLQIGSAGSDRRQISLDRAAQHPFRRHLARARPGARRRLRHRDEF